jgi:DNA polymerase-3 subunit epsilon
MDKSIRSQSFRVLDTETTGLDPRTDAIVELAWAIMRGDGTVLSSNSTLVNPGRPIPADATRIHGISDCDVADAPTLEQAVEAHSELYLPVLPAICHNASFDSVLLRRSPRLAKGNPRFLCTLRLAENLLPARKSYTLDSLRSHLRLDTGRKGTAAHRAAADVAATCSLFKHLIDKYLAAGHPDDIEKLFELSTIQRMPFGKHKGKLLSDIPLDYIDWLLSRDIDDQLRTALTRARKRRRWWWPF